MASFQDELLQNEGFSGLMMGNHALARTMIEAGVQVITTYPGSPTPEIAAALSSIPAPQRPYYFEYSLNEKVATEVACGASLNGHLSCVFFKSVGLNVASDTLIQLPLLELIGGMVIVLGDDPGVNSSQNEQDNRHFARMGYFPLYEPADPQETHDMFLEACELSRTNRQPVLVRMTTHVNHAKQVVRFGPRPAAGPDWEPRFDRANGPYIPIGQPVHPLKARALEKLERVAEHADRSPSNTVCSPNGAPAQGQPRLGVIAASLPALAVLENLEETGAAVDLLKLGLSHPLPAGLVRDFLSGHDEVLVIEELDRVSELEIKALALDEGLSCKLHSRPGREFLQGELTPDRTLDLLARTWPERFTFAPAPATSAEISVRLPQLCPGCGHRSAFHAIKRAMPAGTITVGDIGCHSLGFQHPYEMGEVILCMGHSTGTGAGMAIGNDRRKVISFLGDSTLFHAGLPGIINAVVNDHDLTLVLLENGTTAMTGHQPRPGSGEVGEKIDLVRLFETLGVRFVRDVDAYDQATLAGHLGDALAHEGFAVIIARHPCMLKFTRDRRRKMPGFSLPPVRVLQDVCDRSRVCVEQFACPSFVSHPDGSVTVNEELCIGDGSCLQTCPVSAIERQRPAGGGK